MDRFRKVTADSGVVLRPWLQAFAWKTKTYSPEYILKQVLTSKEHGGVGFLLWNARNDYSKPFAAMPTMTAASSRYFGKTTVIATVAPAPPAAAKTTPHPRTAKLNTAKPSAPAPVAAASHPSE